MASKQLQDLKLSEEQAEQIIELGISLGAVEADDLPESKKDKIQAATEVVAHSLDAWIEDEIRPGDDEADVAEAGETIEKIFALAGVTVDDDNEVTIGEPTDDNGGDEDEDGEDEGDESPFDPDDYIAGYSDMSVVAKVAKVKKLDPSDDNDAAVLEALYEWENEQDKPSSRVLNTIDEKMPQDGDTDETADEAGDADGGDGGEEPWEGYDKLSAVQVKEVLKSASEDEEDPLTTDQVEYVLEYEQNRDKPAPRKRVIDYCKALLEDMQGESDNGGDEAEADEEPEAEEKPKRGRPAKKEADTSNGTIVLTREDILAALADGKVEIEV